MNGTGTSRAELVLRADRIGRMTLHDLAAFAELQGCELVVRLEARGRRTHGTREEVMAVATKKPAPKKAKPAPRMATPAPKKKK